MTADATSEITRPLIERQLELLGRLAEAGLNIALAIERQATDPAAAKVVEGDLGLAYARVARAVRLTVMLQSERIEALQALDRPAAPAPSRPVDAKAHRELVYDRKRRIERIVGRVAQAERGGKGVVERLARETRERLELDEIYGGVLDRPTSEIVAWICKELGLSPDWERLAEEAWAQDEIGGGAPGSPLAALVAARAETARPPDAGPYRLAPHAASP